MPLVEYTFRAMGTACALRVSHDDRAAADEWACAVADFVRAREARWSRYRADSWLSRLNAAAGSGEWFGTEPEDEVMLELCGRARELSGGLIEPAALPLIRLWEEAGEAEPAAEAVERARAASSWGYVGRAPGRVRLEKAGMGLDFGGIAKEFLADCAVALALERGMGDVLVDFGGDIAARGAPPGRPGWLVAVADALVPGRRGPAFFLGAGGVATSGDAARSRRLADGRRRSHVVDPRTGRPVESRVTQVTVLAPTCAQAGFLATRCLLAADAAEAAGVIEASGAAGLIVEEDGRVTEAGGIGRWLLRGGGAEEAPGRP